MKRSSLLLTGALLGGAMLLSPGTLWAQYPAYMFPAGLDRGPNRAPLFGYATPYPYVAHPAVNDYVTEQQGSLLREEVYRSRSDTRRKIFDERRYYQQNSPTYEELRQASLKQRYDQAVNNPPLRNIWNGDSLNDLAAVIHNTEASTGVRGPTVDLNRDVVDNINWTTDPNVPGVAMIRNGSKDLRWPGTLAEPRYEAERQAIGRLLDEAVNAARTASPAAGRVVAQLQDRLADLREDVREQRFTETPENYLGAIGYIRRLGDAVVALRNPGAFRVLSDRIQATTVADLLDQMHGRGLRIAAAVPGRESYYTALYDAMSDYQRGLARQSKSDRQNASARANTNRFE